MSFVIDDLGKVMINGFPQKIHVQGNNPDGRILLILHGGPGMSNRYSVLKRCQPLMDDYIVASWDQRGSAGSYAGVDPKTLTLDQLVEDASAVVEYLREKYKKDMVYILGGSWGSELGTFLVARHPEHIAAYIGYGQVVNGELNEQISWQFTMDKAKEAGDEKAIKELLTIGPPVKGIYKPMFKGLVRQRHYLSIFGGQNNKNEGLWKGMVKPILLSDEFSLADKIGYIKGYKLVLSHMWPSVVAYNFCEDQKNLYVPTTFSRAVSIKTPPAAWWRNSMRYWMLRTRIWSGSSILPTTL